jgi:hypothetical protein
VYGLDVADAAALGEAARDFIARFGPPDVVIANAGVSVGTLTEMADDLNAFERVLRTNVLGMVATFQPFVAPLRARGRAAGRYRIRCRYPRPSWCGCLQCFKAAVIAYLESLRVELHGTGVKVVTIAPGYIETPMTSVNTYPMPFLLPADQAAVRFARAIEAGVSYTVIPWQMGVVGKLLRLLPNPSLIDSLRGPGANPAACPFSDGVVYQPSWVMAGRYFLPRASATWGWVTFPLQILSPARSPRRPSGLLSSPCPPVPARREVWLR